MTMIRDIRIWLGKVPQSLTDRDLWSYALGNYVSSRPTQAQRKGVNVDGCEPRRPQRL